MELLLIYSDYMLAENTLTSTRFCAYSATKWSPFPVNVCGSGCKALRGRLQSFAWAVAKLCVGGCKALRQRWAKLALKSSVLFWIIEKGGQTQHTGHCSPQKNLQNRQMELNECMQEQKNRVSHALRCGLPWLMIGVVRQWRLFYFPDIVGLK